MGGAQAADLPVKAKAVEYVRICSLYGAGFFYIPGTDTCIKLGGYLRADLSFDAGNVQDGPAWAGDPGQRNRYFDYYVTRSRLALTVDTRTATEYGVVRTFGQGDFTFDTLNSASSNPTVLSTNLGNNPNLLSSPGSGVTVVELIFIQFAGFTFGKSASAFSTPWHGYPGNNTSFLLGGNDNVTGVSNIQYTWQFGNGVSATIGADDPTVYDRTPIYNLSVGLPATGATASAYAGTHAPDIVGNIRVDQAWGLWQISASGHEIEPSYNSLTLGTAQPCGGSVATATCPFGNSLFSGHPDTKWGGAVMSALQIKNIPTGPGDDFKIEGTYAKGNTKQVIATSAASPVFAMFGGSNRAFGSIGFGATSDAIWLPVAAGGTGDLKLTDAFGVRGAFNHNWDPFWSSSLFGSASFVRFNGSSTDLTTAKGQFCLEYIRDTGGIAAKSADFSCNPNFNVYQIGVITRWTPVKNLTFSGEVMYTRLDQNFTGTSVLAPSAPAPTTVYEYKDQNTVSGVFRVQRNF
jgi:Porin subfamily